MNKRTYLRYVSLNMAGMVGLSLYILADTWFVSLALGPVGLAALNLSITVFSIISGIGQAGRADDYIRHGGTDEQ